MLITISGQRDYVIHTRALGRGRVFLTGKIGGFGRRGRGAAPLEPLPLPAIDVARGIFPFRLGRQAVAVIERLTSCQRPSRFS